MQLGVKYGRTLWQSRGAETAGSFTLRTVLPTSPSSYDTGKHLTLVAGPQISQQVKLLGKKADGLNNVTIGLGFTYARLFARSYTPTNSALANIPRQNASGQGEGGNDQLGSYAFDRDRLTSSLTFDLPLYKDLSLSTGFRLISRWKPDFEGPSCEVPIANALGGCMEAERTDDRTLYHVNTSFDLSLNYPIYEVVSLTLGYNNNTGQIGEDGTRRGILYSPGAQFYLDITANLDAIYSKVTGRGEEEGERRDGAGGLQVLIAHWSIGSSTR